MNNIPQWQTNLLARFPRPVAVVLIGFISWFIDIGIVYLMFAAWVFGIPLIAFILTRSLEVAGIAFLVAMGAPGIGVTIYDAYKNVDRKLPKREKKSKDST